MSLLNDLFSTLDRRSVGEIAGALGESDQSVSRGLQSAMGTVLGGMASKSGDPGVLQRVLDLAPHATGGLSWSDIAAGIADPNSSWMSVGQRMLSTLFGGAEGSLTQALSNETGLHAGKMSSLMAMAAPMVMSFLGKRVHDEGMTMGGFSSFLAREAPAIRSALPGGVADLLWPREHAIAQPAGARSTGWLLPLLLLALIPALFWLVSHGRKPAAPVVRTPAAGTGTASRAVPETVEIPKPGLPALPRNTDLYFETGSMRLRSESKAKLQEFASALGMNRDARVLVNGYTDNVGNAASNLRLSQERADMVKADLVQLGIPADRISAQGFGEENPIADNSKAEGRGANRRVSVGIGNR